MSGIYIPRMEMPKCCAECFCMEQEDLFCRITERPVGGKPSLYSWDPRPDNCPLIPVPEHGDLIDRDEYVVKLRLKRARCGVGYTSNAITMCMKDANDMPTIIPADKEGEG